ncbi:uncharacterized protein LOC116287401 [Actinia tenebrosa]|uniref:Uncharacterized protein LOC116287401 n=1 Tax=Actinia tenebrosa TaxID=6105 RepID=A0A6P8H2V1_ACTTE|nr:uncharacterized protein LOC116287401 [Actinia tenebrosa]
MATAEPEKEATPEPNPEPLPEWETAFKEWNSWWEIHNFGFGCAFVILALFSLFCLVRLRSLQKLTLGRYFAAVSGLLLVFTTSRALYLLLDPYEGHKYLVLPVVVVRVIFALGYPCLTSVFSLINFAFVEVNSLKGILKKLQNIKFLSVVIVGHFLLVLIIYLTVTFSPPLANLFIICQSILILWWLALVTCFLYCAGLVFWDQKLKIKYFNSDSKTYELSDVVKTGKPSRSDPESQNVEKSKGARKIVRISCAVAIAGLISVVLEFYSLFGVYKLYSLDEKFVKPWPWWSYQTASRTIEICLCCIVAYIVYPTLKGRQTDATNNTNTKTTNGTRK